MVSQIGKSVRKSVVCLLPQKTPKTCCSALTARLNMAKLRFSVVSQLAKEQTACFTAAFEQALAQVTAHALEVARAGGHKNAQ